MEITTLDRLLEDELKDIYNAENQLLEALPNLARAAESDDLRASFERHLQQTRIHIRRLEEICRDLKIEPSGKTCAGMAGLIKEGEDVIESEMGSEPKQAALIGAAQRLEHYEIAAYGTARAHARQLGYGKAFDILTQTLNEEKESDQKLTQFAENRANVQAAMSGGSVDVD